MRPLDDRLVTLIWLLALLLVLLLFALFDITGGWI